MSQPLTVCALIGAAGISAIALTDAVTVALTGEPSFASDENGVTAAIRAVRSGACRRPTSPSPQSYAGGAPRSTVRAVSVAWSGWSSRYTLAVLTITMLIGTGGAVATGEVVDNAVFVSGGGGCVPADVRGQPGPGPLAPAPSPSCGSRRGRSPPSLPALGLAILLGAIGSPWAHPAYVEVLASFGLAFIALAPKHGEHWSAITGHEPTTRQPRMARNSS